MACRASLLVSRAPPRRGAWFLYHSGGCVVRLRPSDKAGGLVRKSQGGGGCSVDARSRLPSGARLPRTSSREGFRFAQLREDHHRRNRVFVVVGDDSCELQAALWVSGVQLSGLSENRFVVPT